jgi:hypothetical protein
MILRFPRPFSLNNMHANVPGKGRVRSGDYRTWCRHADDLAMTQKRPRFIGPVALHIRLGEIGVRETFDGSNAIKTIEDRLVAWGVIEDDNRTIVKRSTFEWVPDLDGCEVEVVPL